MQFKYGFARTTEALIYEGVSSNYMYYFTWYGLIAILPSVMSEGNNIVLW